MITIRLGSIPLSTTICCVIALSDSKYKQPASGFASRKLFTIPITKNVLPVADSPAIAVILLLGRPPYILPLNKALNIYEPVSIKELTSAPSTPSDTRAAYSFPVVLIISFKKSLITSPIYSEFFAAPNADFFNVFFQSLHPKPLYYLEQPSYLYYRPDL